MDDQSKQFLEMETPPSKEAVKTVEMTRYDLEFYINPIDKAVSVFGRTESNFERISTVGKMQCPEKLFVKNSVNQCGKTCTVVLF